MRGEVLSSGTDSISNDCVTIRARPASNCQCPAGRHVQSPCATNDLRPTRISCPELWNISGKFRLGSFFSIFFNHFTHHSCKFREESSVVCPRTVFFCISALNPALTPLFHTNRDPPGYYYITFSNSLCPMFSHLNFRRGHFSFSIP
jgi:hypothetical protein